LPDVVLGAISSYFIINEDIVSGIVDYSESILEATVEMQNVVNR